MLQKSFEEYSFLIILQDNRSCRCYSVIKCFPRMCKEWRRGKTENREERERVGKRHRKLQRKRAGNVSYVKSLCRDLSSEIRKRVTCDIC